MSGPLAITDITPSNADPARLSIRVNGRPKATLAARLVRELGLQVGMAWDDATSAAVDAAVRFESAYRAIAKRIDRRPMSKADVRAKLSAEHGDDAVVDRVVSELERVGLIDDAALGRALIEEFTRNAPAGDALLRDKLLRRGIADATIDTLLTTRSETRDARPGGKSGQCDAVMFATERWPALASLPRATAVRRLAGLLARRGFDEDVVSHAIEKVTGAGMDDA